MTKDESNGDNPDDGDAAKENITVGRLALQGILFA